MQNPILLYDGVCGLCNRLVQFILRRDRAEVFRFASLKSDFAARILARHGAHSERLDTVYIILNYGSGDERVLDRSDASIAVIQHLHWIWLALITMVIVGPHRWQR